MKFYTKILFILCFLISSVSYGQWVSLSSGTNNNLYDIDFPNSNIGFAVGTNGTILKTSNAGQTWLNMNSGTSTDLYALCFLDIDTGFVVGDAGLFKTIDGGTSWTTVSIPTNEYLRDITFVDHQIGFCTGGGGTIMKTLDGGDTWVVKPTTSSRRISSIQFPSPTVGYAVQTGYNWEFFKTTDGGDTWTTTPIAPVSNWSSLEAVFFTDINKGFIGGWYLSSFVQTQDGGNSWSNIDSTISPQVYDVYFENPATGYMVAWYGEIYQTVDSGSTWVLQPSGYSNTLRSICSTDPNTFYIVGESGLILKSANPTQLASTKAVAKHIKLYPNPCHDVLTVDVKIPPDNNIYLSIHNTLGIQMMMQPLLKAHKIEVDVSLLAKGVYTYSISSPKRLMQTGLIVKQ